MSERKIDKVEVFNINIPETSSYVQKVKYDEVKKILFTYMPVKTPGLTQQQMTDIVQKKVSSEVFPIKHKSGWWMKTVQLDLEARGLIGREKTKPVRWYLTGRTNEIPLKASKNNKTKAHPVYEMSDFINSRLISENLLQAYESRPYYQRNDYLGWINNAKQEKTKIKRLNQMIEELQNGDKYMKMPYKEFK